MSRRSTDGDEPTNREVVDRVNDMRRALDAFIAEQRAKNDAVDAWRATHDVTSALRQQEIDGLATVTPQLATLHDFQVRVETLTLFVKYATGGSLIAAVVGVASLVVAIIALSQRMGS